MQVKLSTAVSITEEELNDLRRGLKEKSVLDEEELNGMQGKLEGLLDSIKDSEERNTKLNVAEDTIQDILHLIDRSREYTPVMMKENKTEKVKEKIKVAVDFMRVAS